MFQKLTNASLAQRLVLKFVPIRTEAMNAVVVQAIDWIMTATPALILMNAWWAYQGVGADVSTLLEGKGAYFFYAVHCFNEQNAMPSQTRL